MTSGDPNRGQATATAGYRTAAGTDVIAHRGFAGVHPENTVAAVEASVADGRASMIEIDVMPTADGKIVVFHDDDLGRVTNAPKSVAETKLWELPYERIAGYSVLGTDQSIPRLTDVLAAIPPEIGVNIELKNPGCDELRFAEPLDDPALDEATDRWRAFVGRVLDTAADYEHELLFSSFYEGALAATRELDPSAAVATVCYDSVDTGLRLGRRYDVAAIHVPWNMVTEPPTGTATPVDEPIADGRLVDRAHAEGWRVNAWTVTTWHQAATLRRAGVDGIIADYPGVVHPGTLDATAAAQPSDH
ncbi:MAG: glycerophosphodiester phosphodiesterase [Halohasta sp.]